MRSCGFYETEIIDRLDFIVLFTKIIIIPHTLITIFNPKQLELAFEFVKILFIHFLLNLSSIRTL